MPLFQREQRCSVWTARFKVPQAKQTAEGPFGVYRMAQKNFFSLKGFSEAGTGDNRGSSLAWASQYDIMSAAAFDTFILSMLASIFSCSTSFLAWAMLAVLLDAIGAVSQLGLCSRLLLLRTGSCSVVSSLCPPLALLLFWNHIQSCRCCNHALCLSRSDTGRAQYIQLREPPERLLPVSTLRPHKRPSSLLLLCFLSLFLFCFGCFGSSMSNCWTATDTNRQTIFKSFLRSASLLSLWDVAQW